MGTAALCTMVLRKRRKKKGEEKKNEEKARTFGLESGPVIERVSSCYVLCDYDDDYFINIIIIFHTLQHGYMVDFSRAHLSHPL